VYSHVLYWIRPWWQRLSETRLKSDSGFAPGPHDEDEEHLDKRPVVSMILFTDKVLAVTMILFNVQDTGTVRLN